MPAISSAAERPVNVEVNKNTIRILTDLPDLTIFYDVAESPSRGSLTGDDGGQPGLLFQFKEGELRLTSTASVKGGVVDIKTKWDTDKNPPGRWEQVLKIPQELSDDLLIEVDGEPAFSSAHPDIVKKDRQLWFDLIDATISFKKESTGKTLFKVKCSFPNVVFHFRPDQPDFGILTRFRSNRDCFGNLLDMPESNWKIVFTGF